MWSLHNRSITRELAAKLSALDKSQAVIEFAMDGTIITANSNFLSVMDYSLEDIKGKHHSIFVDQQYKESNEYRVFWATLNRGEFQSAQYKRLGRGGKEVWIEASYNPILNLKGKPYKVVKFATDITERKMADNEYLAKLDAIGKSQAIIEFQMDGTIITANSNFLSAMGYTLEEVKGKHHSIFVDQQYKDTNDYRSFWATLNRGEFQSAQYKRLGKGGKEVWIEASYNPILDLKGKPYKVVKFATDVTKVTKRKAAIITISVKINDLVSSMSSSAKEMNATAETLAAAAEETSVQSVAVASATEELTKSVQEISRQLAESMNVVNSAVTETNNSEKMVAGLIQAAGKIGSVSEVVATIAGQTNLLALNATIEATRAGEAGKGFAVVASEVKSLATQTAKATEEIGQQVQGIQASSRETAEAIKKISEVIAKVCQISTSISGAVEEQSAATNEVASNISGVKTAAEETGRSSTNLLTVSRDISERANELSKEFSEFVKTI